MKSLPSTVSRILVVLGVTTAIALFMNYRLGRAGDWLPQLPTTIAEGGWTSIDDPIPDTILGILGGARGTGRTYTNPFGEWVSVSLITASSFEAFHDPTVCSTGQGFFLKAEARPDVGGPHTHARVMLMRNTERKLEAIEYYWLQNDDGSTDTAKRMGTYKDMAARLKTGIGAVLQGHRTVLVRAFTIIPTYDKNGEQSHRNVLQISRALYAAMRADVDPNAKKVSQVDSTTGNIAAR